MTYLIPDSFKPTSRGTLRMDPRFFDSVAVIEDLAPVPLPLGLVLERVDALTDVGIDLEGRFRFDLYHDYLVPLRAAGR